jgi:hypothetical protein
LIVVTSLILPFIFNNVHPMLPEDVLEELRFLQDGGLIQEFTCSSVGCELRVGGSLVSASIDDLHRLIARARIWNLLSIDS